MIDGKQVEQVIYRGLEALNAERSAAERIPLEAGTVLFGARASLDSLGLVSLISDVETTLNLEHGLDVCLADDRALSRPVSPYATVASLRDYVLELAGTR
jgi:acyl carrier protein